MIFNQRFTYINLILFSVFCLGTCYLEYDGWISIQLHHDLDSANEFSYRGNITIQSLNSGISKTSQEVLSDFQLENLKILAKQNDFYRLRSTVVYGNGVKHTFMTSIKACNLIMGQLSDVIWISIDGAGCVTAVTQTIYTSVDTCGDCDFPELKDFSTDVLIRHTELSPVPDTATFIQKMDRDREARERGEMRDNRGFFAKYWMYIVPVVLLILISGATNQDAAK